MGGIEKELSDADAVRMPRRRNNCSRVEPSKTAPIEVQIIGDDFLDIVRARDIGMGGVGVWIGHGFVGCDISSEVDLVITLPRRKSFVVRSKIRHNTELGLGDKFFGVEFLSLTARQKDAIGTYLQARGEEDPSSVKK